MRERAEKQYRQSSKVGTYATYINLVLKFFCRDIKSASEAIIKIAE